MFRKPKNKASAGTDGGFRIRRRIEEETDNTNIAKVSSGDSLSTAEKINENVATPQQSVQSTHKPSGLSFNEEEGDDVVNFKLKKNTSNHKRSTTQRKHQLLVERMELLQANTKEIKMEAKGGKEESADVIFCGQNGNIAATRQEGTEKHANQLKNAVVQEIDIDSRDVELRETFPTSLAGIPDAKAVYEARKKREMMRQFDASGQGGEFIPLDDTIRLKSKQSGERARLVREDENDMSDEEDTGSFYSAKKLLQSDEDRRREEQAHFLEIEQGGSDDEMGKQDGKGDGGQHLDSDEEDELQRWEREQIRKGVSGNKVMQLQDEMNATSMYFRGNKYLQFDGKPGGEGEAEMDIDMDLEMLETHHQQQQMGATAVNMNNAKQPMDAAPAIINHVKPPPTISLEDVLDGLQQRIANKQELRDSRREELRIMTGQIKENAEFVQNMERITPDQERKFRMLQDVRIYIWNLLDCLNEKITQIDSLNESLIEMWRQRTEFLVQRRRQDVQDQYERCTAAASGRSFMAPNSDFAQRETEREARRNRRRIQRRSMGQIVHHEGESSDDEETPSREVHYRDTLVSVLNSARDLFLDTEDDFCKIEQIMPHLLNWLAIDPRSFEEAYVPLCMPKLFGPLIRVQMLEWRPLKDPSPHHSLHSLPWYRHLLMAGLENSGLDSMEHPLIVQLIPAVVEKIVFPKIASVIRQQWDPLSLNESSNLSSLLRTLVHEYPVASAESKRMREILEQIHTKIRDSLENDIFVPLYSKETIEAVETGCGAFLDRQFWKALKFMRSILCFRSLLSDACLEELLIEGVVNRCAVMALQFSVLANPSTPAKCRALIEQIPSAWLPPKRPSSYRPLAMILKQVSEIHQHKDRKFAEEATKFVNLALSPVAAVKEEVEEEEVIEEG